MAREHRRLAAIVAADVAGYSRLMGRDESGTLARLKAHRTERFEPTLTRHGGRLVKLTGDGALAEFPSAVDALGAAIEFQQAMVEANGDHPEDTAIVFRIGLHLGDLIVEGDDLYEDGVNVAARLEAEAPAGGIVISRTVHEAVVGRLKAKFDDLGSLSLKNIERPVQAFRVGWDPVDWKVPASAPGALSAAETPSTDLPLALPDKPSIAVLPFQNMSGDQEQEYFADGMVEDIITALSRFKSLFVIARNSTFTYKGRAVDIKEVGRELGVRFVLEGSVRKAGSRVRVTAQLIDTLSGGHVWADRYDRALEDIFAVQEEVTQAIVAAIAPQIEWTEQSRATRRRPDSLTAYELALRAQVHAREGGDKADSALLKLSVQEAKQALTDDPSSVLAFTALARANGLSLFLQLSEDREAAVQEALWAAGRMIELDPIHALGYSLRGFSMFMSGQFERYPEALIDARRARELNPNDIDVLTMLGLLEVAAGEAEKAIEYGLLILRLNPRQQRSHHTYQMLAFASVAVKRYADGAEWATRALSDMPRMLSAHAVLAACLVGLGKIEEAKAAFSRGEKLAPEYFKLRLEGHSPLARSEDRKRVTRLFRIAAGLEDPSPAEAVP